MTEQYFNEQAIRAERLARSILDEKACEALMALAREYWEKAEAIAHASALTTKPTAKNPARA